MGSDGGQARRRLTSTERALLDTLLDQEFDGVAELREQARRATASTGCECGCVTIDLHVPEGVPVSRAAGPAPVGGAVVDAAGKEIGGVALFLAHGRLAGLQVYSLDEPLPVPLVERVSPGTWSDRPDDERPSWWRRLRSRPA